MLLKTFNLVPKSVHTYFGTRSKVFKAKNTIIRTFNLVPKLKETFDLVKISSEI